jgi:DNA-binding response OmpR family regulator
MDPSLSKTRQALLIANGYDCVVATPSDVDEKLSSGKFDLVILSAMLTPEEKRQIGAQIPAGTRPLVLKTLVWPNELLRLIAQALV